MGLLEFFRLIPLFSCKSEHSCSLQRLLAWRSGAQWSETSECVIQIDQIQFHFTVSHSMGNHVQVGSCCRFLLLSRSKVKAVEPGLDCCCWWWWWCCCCCRALKTKKKLAVLVASFDLSDIKSSLLETCSQVNWEIRFEIPRFVHGLIQLGGQNFQIW